MSLSTTIAKLTFRLYYTLIWIAQTVPESQIFENMFRFETCTELCQERKKATYFWLVTTYEY